MSRTPETSLGLRVTAETQLGFGGTHVGQGKGNFARILDRAFSEAGISTARIEPSDGNAQTRAVWDIADRLYKGAAQPGIRQSVYDWIRSRNANETSGGSLARLANEELMAYLQATGLPFGTVHGLWGKGLGHRFGFEGDVPPEPLFADGKTQLFVPRPETRDMLRGLGATGDIEVTGFLVPQELHDAERRQERIETLDALTKAEPTKERPLRLAFMMTGQLAHMDILRDQLLKNDTLIRWIKNGQAKLSVYLWTGEREAAQVDRLGKQKGLKTLVTTTYKPYAEAIHLNQLDQTSGLQVFWNSNPDEAIQGSFAMGADADVIFTPLGERIGWAGDVPVIALPPVGKNPKMQGNYDWALEQGLVGPYSELGDPVATIRRRLTTHYDRADVAFNGGEDLHGAERIATIMKEEVGAVH